MNHETIPENYATEADVADAMRRKLAVELGHATIRHERGEIEQDDYDKLFEYYVDQVQKHADGKDPDAVRRELIDNVADVRLESMADLWEARAEAAEVGEELPNYEFKPVVDFEKQNKELQNENSELLHNNLRLSDEKVAAEREAAELRRQIASMQRVNEIIIAELNHERAKNERLELDNDHLRRSAAAMSQEDLYRSLGLGLDGHE